jgi:hypothetical protein
LVGLVQEASGQDYQLSLVTFKDNVQVDDDLAANNANEVREDVLSLTAEGGGNEPEASDEALNTVINGLDEGDRPPGKQIGDFDGTFRDEATKIAVLITDAHPAGFDDQFVVGVDDVNADLRAHEAAEAGILISAVFVPTNGDPGGVITDIMQNYATVTGGQFLQTQPDGSGTAQALQEILSECIGGPEVDVLPGSVDNRIDLDEGGLIGVTILSSGGFDATEVDVDTACFGDSENPGERDCTAVRGRGKLADIDGDGDVDLALYFNLSQTGIDPGAREACLSAVTGGGDPFEACDEVHAQ